MDKNKNTANSILLERLNNVSKKLLKKIKYKKKKEIIPIKNR